MSKTQQDDRKVAPKQSGEHIAPADAFRFNCDAQFQDAAGDRDSKGVREYPVTITARRGGVVDHWYWGRIVHNLSGVRTKDKIALDWCHTNELIGYADQVSAKTGNLVLEGKLVSIVDNDRADEVGRKGSAGIPFESSIFWDPYTAEVHYLQEGATEKVNGQTIAGPCYVVDAWDLRGHAICPYGVDAQTQTKFSAGLPANIPLNVSGAALMSATTTDDNNPAKDVATKVETGATTTQTVTDSSAGTSSGTSSAASTSSNANAGTSSDRAELKRYMDKFGAEAGARYFADGLSYEAALEKHCDALGVQLKAAQDAKAASEQKLKSIDRGADSAISETAAPNKDSAPQKSKYVKSIQG